ncbi:hypothetical protein CFC21_074644 [Triticum aestivum]|uniref:F-box domain-containing protein n=2 Tax=Triticum aestivum TaxID=4565 RepID=A0A9R1KWH2_WHEAT|nr:uncharacterized protein LOC123117570 isoform X2 [Triticum aestivum]KAF7068942.1 hypothetical protein CFC21_074642 [Triticum aestivum]KAF7068945.1 hypothetical protein CFC21_074644 [Triticum aestivum]
MAAPPPPAAALPDELVQEILARLPPDDPASLLRASLVCKAWGLAVSHPGFRRRLHELHQAPPLLGFLPSWASDDTCTFIPTTASSFSLHAPDWHSCRAVDCRHGRALFLSVNQHAETLLVWEPITGAQNRLPVPAAYDSAKPFPGALMYSNAAVLCAADRCDHRDCLGGPFRVVFVFEEHTKEEQNVTSACVYSPEAGAWGELTSLHTELSIEITDNSSVLVGSSLLYFRASASVLEYDLARHALTLFVPPDNDENVRFNLILTEDGRLGLIEDWCPHLKLWTLEKGSEDTDAQWVLSRVINLHNFFPASARLSEGYGVWVMGFVEGANVIFVNSLAGVFTIELQSEEVRKVFVHSSFGNLVPVVTFYTPVLRGVQQHLLVSKPSGEAGGEEGGEGGKTIDQAQKLFDKGSNAISKGDFVNTFKCVSHDHNIRSPGHVEVVPVCASMFGKYVCAYKAQEVNGSLDSVPRSAPIEELVKGTTREDDAGDSKTSGSSVEDAAPSSEKCNSQEVLR